LFIFTGDADAVVNEEMVDFRDYNSLSAHDIKANNKLVRISHCHWC